MSTAEKQQIVERDEKVAHLPSANVTPNQMLALAVERGADMVQLEKLMDLQERWEAGEAKKAFIKAMNAFKADPPKITKNKTVDYTSNGKRTTYDHASLDHICDVIGSALGKHGISYSWDTNQTEAGIIRVECVLTHEAGHSKSTALQAPPDPSGGKNGIQAVGSTVTYLQRYTLLAATGMAVEDQDDDGQGATPESAPPQSDTITPAQCRTLLNMAEQVGKDAAYICEKAHIESVPELKKTRFDAAFNHLKKLQAAQEGDK